MKKIIKSTALLFCICFIAGPSMAQLASDVPASTAAKVAELQKRPAEKTQSTPQLSSDGPALSAAQVVEIQKKQAENVNAAVTPLPAAKPVQEVKSAEKIQSAPAKTLAIETATVTNSDLPKSSVISQPSVVKTVPAQNTDKTIPGTLVPLPSLTMGTGSATPEAVAPASNSKMPEAKLTQEAPKAEAEIPASVAPAKIKVPELPKQGGDN